MTNRSTANYEYIAESPYETQKVLEEMQVLIRAPAPYKNGKGSVQFPLGQPLPADLIRRIVEFRVAQTKDKP